MLDPNSGFLSYASSLQGDAKDFSPRDFRKKLAEMFYSIAKNTIDMCDSALDFSDMNFNEHPGPDMYLDFYEIPLKAIQKNRFWSHTEEKILFDLENEIYQRIEQITTQEYKQFDLNDLV